MKQKIIDIIMYPTKSKRDKRNHEIYLLKLEKLDKLKSSELQSIYIYQQKQNMKNQKQLLIYLL